MNITDLVSANLVNGIPVITALNLADVPAQNVSRYYLRVGDLNGGMAVHVPVFVARGPADTLTTGKKLSLSAAIHGDELNGIRVMQKMYDQLKGQVDTLNGTGNTPVFTIFAEVALTEISYWHTNREPRWHISKPTQLLHVAQQWLLDQHQPCVPWIASI